MHIVAYEPFFSTPNLLFTLSIGTAPQERGCRISLFTARFLWAEASLGAPLGRGFLANAMRVRLCLRLAAGWGSCQTQRPHTNLFLPAKKYLFIRSVRPLCRYNIKKTCGRGNAEPLVNSASEPMGKILGGDKILPKRKNKKSKGIKEQILMYIILSYPAYAT